MGREHTLETAELISFTKEKYGEQHLALRLKPAESASAVALFPDGMPPVHELYVGVPDFRRELSDRMAAAFNAVKGIPTEELKAGVVREALGRLAFAAECRGRPPKALDRIEALEWLADVYEALWWHTIKWQRIMHACIDIAQIYPGIEKSWGRQEERARRRWQDAMYELGAIREEALLDAGMEG